jgi:hypothetical protein
VVRVCRTGAVFDKADGITTKGVEGSRGCSAASGKVDGKGAVDKRDDEDEKGTCCLDPWDAESGISEYCDSPKVVDPTTTPLGMTGAIEWDLARWRSTGRPAIRSNRPKAMRTSRDTEFRKTTLGVNTSSQTIMRVNLHFASQTSTNLRTVAQQEKAV